MNNYEAFLFLKSNSIFPFMTSLNDLQNATGLFAPTEKMLILFLRHGSPMHAIEENEFVKEFKNVTLSIP